MCPLLQKCCRAGSHPGASITITYGVLSNRAPPWRLSFSSRRPGSGYTNFRNPHKWFSVHPWQRGLQGYLGWFLFFIWLSLGCTPLIRLLWLYYEFLCLVGVVTTLETFLDIFFCCYVSTLVVLKLLPGEREKKSKVASPIWKGLGSALFICAPGDYETHQSLRTTTLQSAWSS